MPVTFDADAPLATWPEVTIDPSTDLTDLQTITVRGRNFAPFAAVDVAQCAAENLSRYCGNLGPRRFVTDANGRFRGTLTASRLLGSGGEQAVDCATRLRRCLVVVGADDGRWPAPVPLGFDRTVPPATWPSVVSPDGPLREGAFVDVAVTAGEWTEAALGLQVVLCPSDTLGESERVCWFIADTYRSSALAGGSETDDTRVLRGVMRRYLTRDTEGEPDVDCAEESGRCSLVVTDGTGIDRAVVPVTVTEQTAVRSAIRVGPRQGLVAGDTVQVSAVGLLAHGYDIYQCSTPRRQLGNGRGCVFLSYSFGTNDASTPIPTGGQVPVEVVRQLPGRNGLVDCAAPAARCAIVVSGSNDTTLSARLRFAPADPVPSPEFSVEPSADLRDGQMVGYEVAVVTDDWAIAQCPSTVAAPTARQCRTLVGRDSPTSGTLRVVRVLGTRAARVDCAHVPCELRLLQLGTVGAVRPITFDPDAPPPARPTMTARPLTDLAALARVRVTVTTDRPVNLLQCHNNDCTYLRRLEPSPEGGPDLRSVWVRRALGQTDCATAVGTCVLRLTTDRPGDQLDLALGFDPDPPPTPTPDIAISPATGLADGDVVDLTVTGAFIGFRLDQCLVADGVVVPLTCARLRRAATPRTERMLAVEVTRLLDIPSHEPWDCAARRAGFVCAIVLTAFVDMETNPVVTFAPLRFARP